MAVTEKPRRAATVHGGVSAGMVPLARDECKAVGQVASERDLKKSAFGTSVDRAPTAPSVRWA